MFTIPQKYRLGILVFFATAIAQAHAQPAISRVTVSDSLLKQHVFTLASDSFEGRETGTNGQLKAGLYCTQAFRLSHLLAAFRLDSIRGSFRQTYAFTTTEVAIFGSSRTYGSAPPTYKKHELVPLPLTKEDSSRVKLGHNVAGLFVGTDLKQEVVVVSAHYDHLGRIGRRIYPGADDNASGAATVLSVASVFDSLAQQGIRPRRSILFLLFSGEEGGLLGSDYFVHNSPISLKQIVCDLNVDMVGRVDSQHRKKRNYCYLIAGREDHALRKAAETANQQSIRMELDYAYDTETDPNQYFYRSDHYNFAKFGIPILFFMDGGHADYHQPSDTADKINYEVLQKRATLVFQTAWLVANPTL